MINAITELLQSRLNILDVLYNGSISDFYILHQMKHEDTDRGVKMLTPDAQKPSISL